MTQEFRNRLEMLCFDVIGDHTEVVKEKTLYSPKEFVVEDWDRAVEDNEDFANVELCFE